MIRNVNRNIIQSPESYSEAERNSAKHDKLLKERQANKKRVWEEVQNKKRLAEKAQKDLENAEVKKAVETKPEEIEEPASEEPADLEADSPEEVETPVEEESTEKDYGNINH